MSTKYERSDSELEIVKLAQAGDNDALNKLLTEYRPMIFATAMTIFRNKIDADDATQEIMVRISKKLHSFRGESSFAGWIYPVSHNLCIDLVKKKNSFDKKTHFMEDNEVVEDLAPVTVLKLEREISATKKARLQIQEALESLSEKHRKIIIMREVDGMTYEEMAKVLNVEIGTIMSRLSNARKYFHENLRAIGIDEDVFYKLGT